MGLFDLVLFVTILGSVELKPPSVFDLLTDESLLGLRYVDLHDIGALVSNERQHIEDILSDSVEISRSFVDETSDLLKKINLATKTAHATAPLFKTKVGKKFVEKALKLVSKNTLKFAAKLIPYASEVLDIADGLIEMFNGDDDWKEEFEEKILRKALAQTQQAIQENNLFHVSSFMTTVKQDIRRLNETVYCMRNEYEKNFPNQNVTRVPSSLIDKYVEACEQKGVEGVASTLYVLFQNKVNEFTVRNSSYRHYALLGAPVLIELSLLVSLFEPIAIEITPFVANGEKLSCLYRDALIDHLPFVLEERFQKVNASLINMIKVRNERYNPIGYNTSIFLDCDKGCPHVNCLIDEFGAERFYKLSDENRCEIGYFQHLRHMVESLFPIDVLNKTCNQGWKKPTGLGWATIKLKNFKGSRLSTRTKKFNGILSYDCDMANGCDPYVKVKVDGDHVLTTETATNTEDYNVDRIYNTPDVIQKNKTIITIQVLEDDSPNGGKDRNEKNSEPMLLTSGTVESFMEEPVRCLKSRLDVWSSLSSSDVTLPSTCIQVDIIWQDYRE